MDSSANSPSRRVRNFPVVTSRSTLSPNPEGYEQNLYPYISLIELRTPIPVAKLASRVQLGRDSFPGLVTVGDGASRARSQNTSAAVHGSTRFLSRNAAHHPRIGNAEFSFFSSRGAAPVPPCCPCGSVCARRRSASISGSGCCGIVVKAART